MELPVPAHSQTVTTELGMGVVGQSSEYDLKSRRVLWKIKKFRGGSEQALRIKITFKDKQQASVRKQIGPIRCVSYLIRVAGHCVCACVYSMTFEIPMYNVSNLQVRYLRIHESAKSYNPYRWVRYVTTSQSYVCRL